MINTIFELDTIAEKKKLVAIFHQRSIISGYIHGLLNSCLNRPGGQQKKPAYYDDLSTHLEDAQATARAWNSTIAPSMTAIPQYYINVSNALLGQSDAMTAIFQNLIGGSKDADDLAQSLEELIAGLIKTVEQETALLAASQSATRHYFTTLEQPLSKLVSGASSVNADLAEGRQQVLDVTEEIKNLHDKLQSDINAAIAADTVSFIGLIAAIITIVVAIANPAAGAVAGAVVAGLAFAGSIVGTGITAKSIVDDQIAIVNKQDELSDDNQQVVFLNCLSLTVTGLSNAYQEARFQTGMDAVVRTGETLISDLKQFRVMALAARSDPAALKELLADFEDLQKTTSDLSAFGTEVQGLVNEADATPVKTLLIPTRHAA